MAMKKICDDFSFRFFLWIGFYLLYALDHFRKLE